MQSQSLILLAEVRHNELQTEAARFQIVNQACADRPTAIGVVATALRHRLSNPPTKVVLSCRVDADMIDGEGSSGWAVAASRCLAACRTFCSWSRVLIV
jgi:hypothetical protein